MKTIILEARIEKEKNEDLKFEICHNNQIKITGPLFPGELKLILKFAELCLDFNVNNRGPRREDSSVDHT